MTSKKSLNLNSLGQILKNITCLIKVDCFKMNLIHLVTSILRNWAFTIDHVIDICVYWYTCKGQPFWQCTYTAVVKKVVSNTSECWFAKYKRVLNVILTEQNVYKLQRTSKTYHHSLFHLKGIFRWRLFSTALYPNFLIYIFYYKYFVMCVY